MEYADFKSEVRSVPARKDFYRISDNTIFLTNHALFYIKVRILLYSYSSITNNKNVYTPDNLWIFPGRP